MKTILKTSLCLAALSGSFLQFACEDHDHGDDHGHDHDHHSMGGGHHHGEDHDHGDGQSDSDGKDDDQQMNDDPSESQDCEVWELEYSLTGSFEITGTTAGLGDATREVGPGRMVIRAQDVDGAPGSGKTSILEYSLSQNFSVTAGGGEIITETEAQADGGDCGTALGSLSIEDVQAELVFEACDNGRSKPDDENDNSWGPDDSQSGDVGCLNDYQSTGNVECTALQAVCGFGNLDNGDNPQDETWDQKLNSLVFSADLSSFEMAAVPVPNAEPSSTSLSLSGTLDSKKCVELPASCE